MQFLHPFDLFKVQNLSIGMGEFLFSMLHCHHCQNDCSLSQAAAWAVLVLSLWRAVGRQCLKTTAFKDSSEPGWMNRVPPTYHYQLSTSPLSQPDSLQHTCSTRAKRRTMENKGNQNLGMQQVFGLLRQKLKRRKMVCFLFFIRDCLSKVCRMIACIKF